MIAHVAEAGEDRGRVVLRLGPTARHSSVAVAAAMRVAAAYGSELESLFIEDQQLFEVARFPFVHEIVPLAGRRSIGTEALSREIRATASLMQRHVAALAADNGIRVKASIVRDEPVRALSRACAASGPWNVIVLGEPVAGDDVPDITDLFDAILDTTGIVVAGEHATAINGPVVAVIEELGRLPPMLRAAQRLAATQGGEISLAFLGDDPDHVAWMDAQARLAVGESPQVTIVAAQAVDGPDKAARVLCNLRPGFVIAQFGGLLVHPEAGSGSIARLKCPIFLVR